VGDDSGSYTRPPPHRGDPCRRSSASLSDQFAEQSQCDIAMPKPDLFGPAFCVCIAGLNRWFCLKDGGKRR
jgi:hypothetical protein